MNNFSTKRHLHPMTFDFLDIPDSRHVSQIDFEGLHTPHIHSVYLVHENTRPRFEGLIEERFDSVIRHPRMDALVSIHAVRITASDIQDVIAYSSKMLEVNRAVALVDDAPLFNQFPLGEFEQRTRRAGLRQNRLLSQPTQDEKEVAIFEKLACGY
jgi:hypothetical protein